MGGGIGRLYSTQFLEHISEYSNYYNSLHLSHDDIFKLYLLFNQLDHLKKGWVTYPDLIKYLKLCDTKFIYKIFHLFDSPLLPSSASALPSATSAGISSSSDNNPYPHSSSSSHSLSSTSGASSKIYFYQFVISLWGICTLYQKDYILYLYNLYDLDETGFLDIKLSQQIIEDIFGPEFNSSLDAQRAYEQLGTIPMKSIDPYTFQRYGGNNPRILFQIFTIQSLIRNGFGGEEFWEELAMKRAQLNPGIHVSVHSLLGHSRRGKLRSISRSYAYHTASSAGAYHSSEDFKMSRQQHGETEDSSVKCQLFQPSFLRSFNENRKDYFQSFPVTPETPDLLEMETLP